MAAGYDDDPPVLARLNLRIDDDDRIALLGANGNGKSTFAKLITGKLAPVAGRIHRHSRLGVGYFAQHQLDELAPTATPYENMRRLMPDATEAQRRARLGFYGFGADLADTPAQNLSGGEKARLLFALAAFHGPHLLVLDEPTNHLDVDAREALVHALNEFAGAVVLISHDRHLIETCADRLWIAGERTVKPYDGDLNSYAELVLQRARIERQARGAQLRTATRAERRERANPGQIRRRIADAETTMGALREKIAVLDRALEDSLDLSRGAAQGCRFRRAAAEARGRSRAPGGSLARAPERNRWARSRTGWLSIALSIKLVAALAMPTLRVETQSLSRNSAGDAASYPVHQS